MAKQKKVYDYDKDDDRTILDDILGFAKVFVVSAIVIMVLINFIAYPVSVVGRSMKPTLNDGDHGFTSIISTYTGEPERGDIVVITIENPETGATEHWVKRIVGMPGETIKCEDEQIYINGKAFTEDYLDDDYIDQMIDEFGYVNMDFDEVQLGDDQYFVMGDNRPYSEDSRYERVGPITKDQILGEGVFVFWPLSDFGWN